MKVFGLSITIAFILSACSVVNDPRVRSIGISEVLSNFSFETQAAIMATDDSLPINMIATNINGGNIEIIHDSILWSSSNPSLLTVSDKGVIRASGVSDNPVLVIAAYTHNGSTKRDTLLVTITQNKGTATSVSIVPLDSTRIGSDIDLIKGQVRLRIDLYSGETLSSRGVNLPLVADQKNILLTRRYDASENGDYYEIRNDASVGAPVIGRFTVFVSLNYYGSVLRDSIELSGLYPAYRELAWIIQGPDSIGILSSEKRLQQPCAATVIRVFTLEPVDILFSDSLSAANECSSFIPGVFIPGNPSALPDQIGGNLISVTASGMRRSRTLGIINVTVVKSLTKEPLSRFQIKQVDVLDQ